MKNAYYFFCFTVIFVFSIQLKAQQTFYDINTIQQIEIFFNQPNWKTILDSLKAGSDGYLTADSVRINGVNFPQSNVKFKGNSSYDASFKKNPFTIKLDKNITQDYQSITSIKLSNIYQDPSVIREALGYHILSHYMHCSRANFAQVYVNGVMQGLYTNVEDVTKTFVAAKFKSNKNNTLIKCNPVITPGPTVKSNLKYIDSDSNSYANFYEMESSYGWNDLVSFADLASNNAANIASQLDVDRMLWMMAFDNVLVNLDSYIGAFAQNYFMFKDNNGILNPIVWDLNMCFGAFPYLGSSNTSLNALGISQQKQMTLNVHENDVHWPIIKAVLANPTYKRMYVAHMKTMVSEMFANNYYKTHAAALQQIIDSAVQVDSNNFFTYNDFKNGLIADISLGNYMAPGIANLMDARVTYLQSVTEFKATAPNIIQVNPILSKTDSMVTVSVKTTDADSVFLGYRLNVLKKFTRIPMYDDGLHNDGAANDNTFGVSIKLVPEQSQYYIYAQNNNAAIFSPQRAEHEYYSIDLATGLNQIQQTKNTILLFPNPANTLLTVKAIHHSFYIVDVMGKTIYKGYNDTTIDTQNWTNGVYFMIADGVSQKIIIQH